MPIQQPGSQEDEERAARLAAQAARRRKSMLRLVRVGLLCLLVFLGASVTSYIQYGYWQLWVDGGGIFLAFVCLLVAYWLIDRGRLDVAGYLMLLAAMLAWAGGELGWAGETGYNLFGGLLLIVLVGMTALPGRWRLWLVTCAVFTLYILAVARLEPLPRVDVISSSLEMRILWISLIAVLAILFLWQVVQAYMRIGTIRIRLLVAFVALVGLVIVILGVGLAIGGLTGVQQQVMNQLESVSILKEAEIDTWVQDLQFDLSLALLGDEVVDEVSALLDGDDQEETGEPDGARGNAVRARLTEVMNQGGRYEEIFLLDRSGRVALSTNAAQEGTVLGSQIYFREGLVAPYIQTPRHYTDEQRIYVFASRPVQGRDGQVLGVLVGRASMDRLNEIMAERSGLGDTGETYLVGGAGRDSQILVTPTRLGEVNVWAPFGETIVQAIQSQQAGVAQYENHRGEAVVGAFRWLPSLKVMLLAEQSQMEAFAPVYTLVGIAIGVGMVAVLIAVGFSLLLTRSIATPLAALAETATQIAAGDLERVAAVAQEDEIGTLAWAFNSMTAQLRELISSLEERVADRTQELEQRSLYLEAAAEVGRTASSILQAEYLMDQVVSLIQEEFGLYYVGLFLVDETGEWAVLQAGTGENRWHRLRVDQDSMVGWCIVHGEPWVAGAGDKDAEPKLRTPFPEQLETGSEAALPLHSRGQVIGALVVQDIQSGAFDQDTVVVLRTMADQVAVALDNAKLFAERQDALDMAQRAYGELSREAWTEILQARPHLGFRSSDRGVGPVGGAWPAESELALELGHTVMGDGDDNSGQYVLSVPIQVRGQVIGVLDTFKPVEAGEWTPEEVALLERIAEELDPALEGARLYQDTQRRAAREQTLRQVTERMRQAVDVEAVLQNTVIELARALGAPRAYVRLGTDEHLHAVAEGEGRGGKDEGGVDA